MSMLSPVPAIPIASLPYVDPKTGTQFYAL